MRAAAGPAVHAERSQDRASPGRSQLRTSDRHAAYQRQDIHVPQRLLPAEQVGRLRARAQSRHDRCRRQRQRGHARLQHAHRARSLGGVGVRRCLRRQDLLGGQSLINVSGNIPSKGTFTSRVTVGPKFTGSWNCHGVVWQETVKGNATRPCSRSWRLECANSVSRGEATFVNESWHCERHKAAASALAPIGVC